MRLWKHKPSHTHYITGTLPKRSEVSYICRHSWSSENLNKLLQLVRVLLNFYLHLFSFNLNEKKQRLYSGLLGMLQSRANAAGLPCLNSERAVWSRSPLRLSESPTSTPTSQLARRAHHWPDSQQMPPLSTDSDSRDHPFSTERFSGGPLIMIVTEGQLVHKVSLSGPVPKAPTPPASNQAGIGRHWEAGREAETHYSARGAQGAARKSLARS